MKGPAQHVGADFPEALWCLIEPSRLKVLWGGRGSGKSWGIARALLIQASQRRLRILCARETMSSISESVHALLADQIAELQLPGWKVGRKEITHVNGSQITFAQLRHNVQNFKGAEAIDICWVEEAANVSKASWDILIPTIRKENSEIWISFNPVLATDATYTRFVLTQRPDAIVRKLSWRDNPWFPKVLDVERRHLLLHDPVAYAHVWEGECRSTVEGAIYAKEMAQAQESGRICDVPYDPMTPVQTVWDLGFGDKTAIWFVQPVSGWLHFIDYYENSGETIEHYVRVCQSKPYIYAEDWLPHDGVDTIIHGRLAGDRSNSIEQIMRALNRKPRIVPKMLVSEGINAARMKFPTRSAARVSPSKRQRPRPSKGNGANHGEHPAAIRRSLRPPPAQQHQQGCSSHVRRSRALPSSP